jgi:hypothetical protein
MFVSELSQRVYIAAGIDRCWIFLKLYLIVLKIKRLGTLNSRKFKINKKFLNIWRAPCTNQKIYQMVPLSSRSNMSYGPFKVTRAQDNDVLRFSLQCIIRFLKNRIFLDIQSFLHAFPIDPAYVVMPFHVRSRILLKEPLFCQLKQGLMLIQRHKY